MLYEVITDLETEQVIMQGIREKFRNKIIISIAHRINTLKEADSILVLSYNFV